MTRTTTTLLPFALVAALAGSAFAASHIDPALSRAISVRQSHMALYGFNLGPLGAMAQDKMPYDAAVATRAAQNLAALASIDQTGYWPEGTDTAVGDTRALPAIWTDMAGFTADQEALVAATTTLAEVAGTDLASVKTAFGDVGAACGACHKAYRAPDE